MIESWILNEIFQDLTDPFLITVLVLVAIHFGTPLAYYRYAKTQWLPKPWNIKVDENYRPKVTVIVPTYNEARFIEKKLNNIYEQEYPKDKLEVIIVDSASDDGTPELVRKWAGDHPDLNLKLIEEPVRRGKARALNLALKQASGDILITADVDAWWSSKDTLQETVKWFADPTVGAVSCVKEPASAGIIGIEKGYRRFYNALRVAESKAWSTTIFHGELAAFRKRLIYQGGGFPIDIGADDSHMATRIALMGYRAIIPENVVSVESIPEKGYFLWKVRRAQHLVQHFTKMLKEVFRAPNLLRGILIIEIFLHLINPWIFVTAIMLITVSTIQGNITAVMTLFIGGISLKLKSFRTWVIHQIYLLVAQIRNLYTKELIWKKE